MKIYLSPSNQPSNTYTIGGTNEKTQCEAIAKEVGKRLWNYECEPIMAVYTNTKGTYEGRPQEAKQKGSDFYLAIHTNAGANGSKTTAGTVAFYHRNNAKSKVVCENLVKELNAISPVKSNRSQSVIDGMTAFSGSGYGEIREPMNLGIPPCLLEINFHDNPVTAAWIAGNHGAIADGIVKALVNAFGLKSKAIASKIYRVQVGAYAVKSNAEAMLAKLKAAGYDAFITSD